MISIIEVQLATPVPNNCWQYHLSERDGKYSLEWDSGSDMGRVEILNSRDVRGADGITKWDIPVWYCDNVITWEDNTTADIDSAYEDDEDSVFYREDSESDSEGYDDCWVQERD
jgi:hypothetical protein